MTEMNYKDTLNLPTTSFPMKANLNQKEPGFLKEWYANDLYSKIKLKSKGKPKYILHDGPPYANGNIHIGHALNKILKDIIVKCKTMQGFDSHYVPGWDCHGLPIEHALFKQLGISKDEIDQIKFRKKARAYAEKYIKIQKEDFKRLGIFGEWESPYLTMNYDYQAVILETFKKLYDSGYIYKGEKPIHWCSDCETALAEAELEYAEKESDSIFVRMKINVEHSTKANSFPLVKKYAHNSLYLMIWTTTPWTLPANTAVAFHPSLEYVLAEDVSTHDFYIFAHDRLEAVCAAAHIDDLTIHERIRGHELENIAYTHPFIDRISYGRLATFVSNEDGCGCVHIAPGHGQEDYQVGLAYGLDILSPVNDKGEFTSDFPAGEGVKVLEGNGIVLSLLKEKKALLSHTVIKHSYPHCWRCKKPVIFRATKQWFLNIEHENLRQRLMDVVNDENRSHWVPEWGKNRILGMLETRPDWCLSRQRYWGVPIPMLYCTECEKEHFPDKFEFLIDMVKKRGADVWFETDPNEFVEKGTVCSHCGNSRFKKEHDIVDVWFDSGVSHQAVLKNNPSLQYPCELYLEGSDQHRGWFQTSLITSLALENTPPFKHVVTHGFTVDGDGKKMSKSAGNVVSPQDIINTYGSDILRLWVSSCDISQDVRISDDIIKQMADAYRKIRNTLRYLVGNLFDYNFEKDEVVFAELDAVDKWAVGKVQLLVEEVTADYESFRFHHIYRKVYNFCVLEMSSFYLDILKDRMYTARRNSHIRRSSQTAIFLIVKALVKILAPILSFTTEELWKSFCFDKDSRSVHLSTWPDIDAAAVNRKVIEEWDALRELRECVNPLIEAKRNEGLVGSSLEAHIVIFTKDEALMKFLRDNKASLGFVLIVSYVTLADECDTSYSDYSRVTFQGKQLSVLVKKAEGAKCVRCWNYSSDIGVDQAHPELCPKCLDAVK
jgi:isoleucyl-tRNA synthetase